MNCSPCEVFSPNVIEVQSISSQRELAAKPGCIGMLVGPFESWALADAKARLQSGITTLAELIVESQYHKYPLPSCCPPEIWLTLKYRQRTIASLKYPAGSPFRGVRVPFCGGPIPVDIFHIEYRVGRPANVVLEPHVIIERPELSKVETRLTEIVPFKLSSFATSQRGLMIIMEEGWALGGYLAKLAELLRQWRRAHSAAPDERPSMQEVVASHLRRADLAISAESLLEVFRKIVHGARP